MALFSLTLHALIPVWGVFPSIGWLRSVKLPGLIGSAADLVAVWDVNLDWMGWQHRREAEAWAVAHDLISAERGHPKSGTWRIEFWLIDTPSARCYRFAKDADGHPHADPGTGEPVMDAPADVLLSELPPQHLIRDRDAY